MTAHDAASGKHEIRYDDGEVERVALAKETLRWGAEIDDGESAKVPKKSAKMSTSSAADGVGSQERTTGKRARQAPVQYYKAEPARREGNEEAKLEPARTEGDRARRANPIREARRTSDAGSRSFWPEDQRWYAGVVEAFDAGKHAIRYSDGERERVRLAAETFRWTAARRRPP